MHERNYTTHTSVVKHVTPRANKFSAESVVMLGDTITKKILHEMSPLPSISPTISYEGLATANAEESQGICTGEQTGQKQCIHRCCQYTVLQIATPHQLLLPVP